MLPPVVVPSEKVASELVPVRPLLSPDVARLIKAVTAVVSVLSVPFVWLGWWLWGPFNFFRPGTQAYFYDLQARAILHGHLWVPTGSLNFEGFINHGKTYTYFGIFPSLLRIPILFFTNQFDGRLTVAFIILAYLLSAAIITAIIWRLRIMLHGDSALGRAEAVAYGLLVGALTGGSIFMNLISDPRVYEDDIAWGIALGLLCLFALLGLIEKITNRRLLLLLVALFSAAMNRGSVGDACIGGTVLLGLWLGFGRGEQRNRRAAVTVVAIGAFCAACVMFINQVKFGNPFNYDLHKQVWTAYAPHRREFLRVNASPYGPNFVMSNLWTLLRFDSFRLSWVFPFITLPLEPSAVFGHVYFDMTYPMLSLPDSMPAPFILGTLGTLTVFWRRAHKSLVPLRIVVLTGLAATVPVISYGYIGFRYLGDFVPFVAISSSIGLVYWWPRFWDRSRRWMRVSAGSLMVLLLAWAVVVNVGPCLLPLNGWSSTQSMNFIDAEKALSGASFDSRVHYSSTLPMFADDGELYIINSCSSMYLATQNWTTQVDGWDLMHTTWIPLLYPPGAGHFMSLVLRSPLTATTPPQVLVQRPDLQIVMTPVGPNRAIFKLIHTPEAATHTSQSFGPVRVLPHRLNIVSVFTDTVRDQFIFSGFYGDIGPVQAGPGVTTLPRSPSSVAYLGFLREQPNDSRAVHLCHELLSRR